MASLRNQNANQRAIPGNNQPLKPQARKPLQEFSSKVTAVHAARAAPSAAVNGKKDNVIVRQDDTKKPTVTQVSTANTTAISRLPTLSGLRETLPYPKRQKVLQELVRTTGKENGFLGVRERPANVDDIYKDDLDNESVVVAYVEHIYAYLHTREVPRLSAKYMEGMSINPRMRAILVDWVVSVVYKFKMCQDTLYLAVDVIDRFLAIPNLDVTKDELQLIGVTAMFIASKFEEVYPPELEDYVFIADNACTKDQILHTEMIMTNALNFDFTRASTTHFIRRCCKAAKFNNDDYSITKYICELALLPIEFVEVRPSLVAAAATYLMRVMRHEEPDWTSDLEYYAGYKEKEIKPVAAKLLQLVIDAPKGRQQCIYKKYSNIKFGEASLVCVELAENAQKFFQMN